MPATVTLATTTLQTNVGVSDTQVNLASISGLVLGSRLYVDRELMAVMGFGVNTQVNVRRGVDGTASAPHNSLSTVYVGTADQFYSNDPVGNPLDATLVSPWINIRNGSIWFAQGDIVPNGQGNRWWQQATFTYSAGPLGVRTTTMDPTSST